MSLFRPAVEMLQPLADHSIEDAGCQSNSQNCSLLGTDAADNHVGLTVPQPRITWSVDEVDQDPLCEGVVRPLRGHQLAAQKRRLHGTVSSGKNAKNLMLTVLPAVSR